MISFNRILFPVDLSRASYDTAPFVTAMAARFRATLHVLHVSESRVSPYPVPAVATPGVLRQDSERHATAQARLNLFRSEAFNGIPTQSHLDEGDAAQKIVCFARTNRIDLIMMPTHGYGTFRRLLLGSVTAKVLHDIECPVWTGVHTDRMELQTGVGWRQFLCAIDDDPCDVPLLKWASQFASEQQANLTVVHAVHADAPIAGGESDSLREFLTSVARERIAGMQSDAGTSFEIKLPLGPVGRVIREAALNDKTDLILIGRGAIHKSFGRLRSNAYAIIRDAPCPVISL